MATGAPAPTLSHHDDRISARTMKRPSLFPAVAFVVVALIGVAALIGFGAGHYTTPKAPATTTSAVSSAPVDPKVAAGAHAFVGFACVQCHGMNGEGGVSPDVPALTSAGSTLTVAQLTQIINHGL